MSRTLVDPKAVSFIAEHGGSLHVYADASGRKHVTTEAPNDPSIRFEQIEADGFLMFVEVGIEHAQTWTVEFDHLPHPHLEVAWEGHPEHPLVARTVCTVVGHRWKPDPDSEEIYPVVLCRRCGKRRELSERLVSGLSGMRRWPNRPI